jgi:hypothetical protein
MARATPIEKRYGALVALSLGRLRTAGPVVRASSVVRTPIRALIFPQIASILTTWRVVSGRICSLSSSKA